MLKTLTTAVAVTALFAMATPGHAGLTSGLSDGSVAVDSLCKGDKTDKPKAETSSVMEMCKGKKGDRAEKPTESSSVLAMCKGKKGEKGDKGGETSKILPPQPEANCKGKEKGKDKEGTGDSA